MNKLNSFILPFIMTFQGSPDGGGGYATTLLLIIIIIIAILFLLPFIKAFQAAKGANKFKTLVFVTTFYEWVGWIICITIIGLPLGLGLVLLAQIVRLLIQIETNTSKANS